MAKEPDVSLLRPWERVKDPVAIPDPLDVDRLDRMPDIDFARLLRDHLVPREAGVGQRAQWDRLWMLLGRDERLAGRAYDVLEGFLDAVEAAPSSGVLDEQGHRRMRKFTRFCDDAWQRLQLGDDRPLGWAGRAATGFNPAARRVLERLVNAIDTHRREVTGSRLVTAEDEKLWAVLCVIDLDPEGPRSRRRP